MAELPVTHKTRRHGRPYTLVLTKTAHLFERERQARVQQQADLDWLTAEWHRRHGWRQAGGAKNSRAIPSGSRKEMPDP